ncbi:MAG: hypothetical protein IJ061_02160 [Lachnospiraceae bacterium]|nr:hypothetical protein [Lachnospiraceae bacterium]
MNLKKKIAASAAAVLTAASVAVAGLFGSPAELVTGRDQNPKAAVEMIVETADQAEEAEDMDDSADEKKKGFRNLLRQRILKIPVVLRALAGVPLWALGWAVSGAMSALWSGILSPVLSAALGWIILGVCLLAAGAITIKLLFPDVPLRKILNRENVLTVAGGTALLALLCSVLPVFWEDYGRFDGLIKFAGGLLILGILILKAKFGAGSFDRAYSLN